MVRSHITLTSGVQKLQDLAQKICTSEKAQEEAEVSAHMAGLVSGHTLPWQLTDGLQGTVEQMGKM